MSSKKPAMHKPAAHKAPAHKAAKPATTAMPKAGSETDYRAQSDMHALAEAAKIKADPQRHTAAKAVAREQVHHLRKVAGRK